MHRSFGPVTVASAGTPTPATTEPTAIPLQYVMFQALPGNAGRVYIRRAGSGDDRVTLTETMAILQRPASATDGPFASYTVGIPNGRTVGKLQDYAIDADETGDGVLISGITPTYRR